jgi:phosphate transport system permease protein
VPDVSPAADRITPTLSSGAVGDVLFRAACQSAAWLIVAVAVSLVCVLAIESWPFFRAEGFEFLRAVAWNPGGAVPSYGGLALVYGTLATSAIALLLAVPLGVGTAAFLAEIAPPGLRTTGAFLLELLAAIPSVVYGLWGLQVFAPRVGGPGILPAGLTLAVMVIPYVTAVSYEACRAVPRSQRESALALGATRWQMIRTAVLPYARPGIVGGCFLALGRALGETMAVTMIIGNKALSIESPIGGAGDSIASVIANQLNEATSEKQRSGLVGLGLLLLAVTVIVNVAARLLIRRVGKSKPRAARGSVIAAKSRAALLNRVMTWTLAGCFVATLAPLFLILGQILVRGIPGLSGAFFTQLPEPPGEGGGLAHALVGSALVVGLAAAWAVPFGVLAAVFLAEFRTARSAAAVRFVGEVLAGVPSIIVGVYAYALWVEWRHFSAWAAAFALGVITIPIVMRTTEEALRSVPESLRNASYALGAAHWQTTLLVTLPAALPAVITGVFLAIARIAGETAPLLLTAYGSSFLPRFPQGIDERTPFLPKYVYDYARSGFPDWESQAWTAALVLLAVVVLLNVGIRVVTGRRTGAVARADQVS